MEFTFNLTQRDMFAFSLGHALRRKATWAVIILIPTLLVIFFFRNVDWNLSKVVLSWLMMVIGYALFCLVLVVVSIGIRIRTKGYRALLGSQRVVIEEGGIELESGRGRSEIKWSGIQKIVTGKKQMLLYTSPINALVIPRRVFVSDNEYLEFCRQTETYFSKT